MGSPLGFKSAVSIHPTLGPPANHLPVVEKPHIAKELIQKEVKQGRILGLFMEPPLDRLICSPLNLVSKAGNPSIFCLIHNLAFPYNHKSVNANIPDHQAVVSYVPSDIAVQICQFLGPNCYILKMDYNSAFRIFSYFGFWHSSVGVYIRWAILH